MSTITFLLTILAILAILSPIFSSPIEPRRFGHQIDYGVLTSDWVPGYIGDRPFTGPDGDYLRATFCYCKTLLNTIEPRQRVSNGNGDGQHSGGGGGIERRQRTSNGNREGQHSEGGGGIQPGEVVQGHYWRYEYFNYHDNATYFLNHYCMEDAFPQDNYGCGYDAPGKFMPAPDSYWHSQYQNDWSFTYSPLPNHARHSWTVYKKQQDVDWIMYGRGELVKQQKRRLDKWQGLIEMPKEYVDEKCNFYCDTEMRLPMDPAVKSHGELYNDIDDMCDRCA